MVEGFWHDLVLGGADQPAQEQAWAALAPRFSVEPAGRAHTLRHTWLDTFDWRLHRAGLTLEHTTGTGVSEYILAGCGNGERLTARATRTRWPALAGALPPGPLHDRVEQMTGIRALLPAARATSSVRQLRVMNTDRKTVAWLTMDQLSVTYPATASLPTRLSAAAVRGYQSQASQIVRCLAQAPGVTEASLCPLDAALAAVGRHAEDYTDKMNVELEATMAARLAVGTLLLRLLDTLEANVAGTVRDLDTEFLHDLRVAVRRTRTALKLAGDVLPGGVAGRFRDEFKWLGDATTPTRDLDVYLLNYPSLAAGLLAATPDDLAPFHAQLIRQRALERRRLVRALRSARFTSLTSAWRSALTGLSAPSRGPSAARLAADRIRRTHRRVLTQGAAITDHSPPENLHDLRKRCKELRYALEFFASLHDPDIHQRVVRDLKGLQNCLGEFQDCQVQQHEIVMFATQMMHDRQAPATALLAMGELAGQVAVREHRARSEFAGRFASFASEASQRRFRDLTRDAGA